MGLILTTTPPRARGGSEQPLVTFLLVTYQQEAFVAEAVRSVLNQNYSPLQIVISDDCSTDSTWDIIVRECEGYDGPHQLVLNRNTERLYLHHTRHIQPMLEGKYIVLGCGDDVFMSHRVAANVDAFRQTGASVVTSNYLTIDGSGTESGVFRDPNGEYDVSLEAFFENGVTLMFHGASMAWDREAIDSFGPFPVMRNIDWLIPFRGLMLGGNHYIREPLIAYRIHDKNLALGLKLKHLTDPVERERIVEAQRCQRIINDHFMREDIEKLRALQPNHPKLAYLAQKMNERLAADLREWADLRVSWVQRGIGA